MGVPLGATASITQPDPPGAPKVSSAPRSLPGPEGLCGSVGTISAGEQQGVGTRPGVDENIYYVRSILDTVVISTTPQVAHGKESACGEMQVESPDQEDPLEREMEIHSSMLAWEIP